MRVGKAGRRQGQDCAGDHPLGQIVDPLKTVPPRRGCHMPGPEQPFQRALCLAPFPPAAAPPAIPEIGRGQRSLRADTVEHLLCLVTPLARKDTHASAIRLSPLSACCMRQRSRGWSSNGSSEASCAQYSNSWRSRLSPHADRSIKPRSYIPRREKLGR